MKLLLAVSPEMYEYQHLLVCFNNNFVDIIVVFKGKITLSVNMTRGDLVHILWCFNKWYLFLIF